MYNNPGAFGITVSDRPVAPLPEELSPLQPVLAPLFKRWQAAGREELARRMREMRAASSR